MDTNTPVLTDDDIEHAHVFTNPLSSRKVIRVGSIVAKLGRGLDLTEAENMKFIRKHTDIPVPKVLNCYEKDGPKLSLEAKDTIVSELSHYIRQMRQIPAPVDSIIASVTGGPAMDQRSMRPIRGGPFRSKDFNAWQLNQLIPGIPLSNRDLYHAIHRADHAIVFTHGDLGFHNVLVQNSHVAAIIN